MGKHTSAGAEKAPKAPKAEKAEKWPAHLVKHRARVDAIAAGKNDPGPVDLPETKGGE